MNQQEFDEFRKRLFIAYPSLNEWLAKNSPDPVETLRSWQRRLSQYTLAECQSVLDRWERGNREPWKAYERDQVPSVIASVIQRDRELAEKREQQERERRDFLEAKQRRSHRSGSGVSVPLAASLDSSSVAAMNDLIPHHRKLLDGELTRGEYNVIKNRVLARLDQPTTPAPSKDFSNDFAAWSG